MEAEVSESLPDEQRLRQLAIAVSRRAPLDAVVLLMREPEIVVSNVLGRLDLTMALRIMACLPSERAEHLSSLFESRLGAQWEQNSLYEASSVGRLMEPVDARFSPDDAIHDVVESLRPYAQDQQLSYAYVVDAEGVLAGVVAMRELLFADDDMRVRDIMVTEPFYFHADTDQEDAMRAVVRRHYPVYPVCDGAGRLLGMVRGYALFEQQTYELTAQAGRMVGVEKEEHLNTPWTRCLTLRHPWLQLNLLTAFVAGAVVGLFESTIQQVVALAAFLPVLAGQSGNTGCQALAVTLRAMTLNELKPGMEGRLIRKETLLGLSNGV
ncbi:MAG: magnesium transporter, partial [Pseudomonadales bacterium]|nr:magnesium transporter [Pseudomonadales bacterium]